MGHSCDSHRPAANVRTQYTFVPATCWSTSEATTKASGIQTWSRSTREGRADHCPKCVPSRAGTNSPGECLPWLSQRTPRCGIQCQEGHSTLDSADGRLRQTRLKPTCDICSKGI